jgi:division/cell wall cluster transcriptional repressor MraZ
MFYGEYEHTIDEKSRLTLPARFRNAFASGVVLARGLERNIDVFPRESWDANVVRIAELDSLTREAREMKRYVFAGASVAELDKQGRVIVPLTLAEHAGIGGGRDRRRSPRPHRDLWTAPPGRPAERDRRERGDVAERLADRRRTTCRCSGGGGPRAA